MLVKMILWALIFLVCFFVCLAMSHNSYDRRSYRALAFLVTYAGFLVLIA